MPTNMSKLKTFQKSFQKIIIGLTGRNDSEVIEK